tara:strand:+ start:380 stop:787 length:408 start_codon:yes stop_codon:yes gene_type:complete
MIKENIFKNKFRFNLINNNKVLFLIYGLVNVVITNLLLQLFLLFFPIFFSTLISQIFNLNFGFYLYGLKVFKVKFLGKKIYFKYLFFHLFLWILNWFLINFIHSYNISKNLAALFVVPILALISFVYQKNIVFIK